MTLEKKAVIIREALKDLHKNETFERALGRTLRRHKRNYEDYLEIIGEVRKRARREKVDVLEAARREALSR
ncbi:MAG: hypothetical protein ACE5HJ_06705 [Thermoplasmata archaeon]